MQKNFNLVWKNTSLQEAKKQKKSLSFPASDLIKRIIESSNELKDQTIVIKLDSSIIANQEQLSNFAENVNILISCGAKIVIVHDYSKLLASSLKLLGINDEIILAKNSIDHRNTAIIEMVLSGYINKLIVAKLCELGCYAIGISGKDGNLIQAKTLKSSHKRDTEHSIIDIGFVSEPVVVNPEILLNFEDMDIIPVISPIGCDKNGRTHILDVNLTASVISNAMGANHLVLLYEEAIIKEDNSSICDLKTLQNLWHNNNEYRNQSMFKAAYNSIENSNNIVHFIDAKIQDALLFSFFPSL